MNGLISFAMVVTVSKMIESTWWSVQKEIEGLLLTDLPVELSLDMRSLKSVVICTRRRRIGNCAVLAQVRSLLRSRWVFDECDHTLQT